MIDARDRGPDGWDLILGLLIYDPGSHPPSRLLELASSATSQARNAATFD
jgi:hypothetical protein